MLLLPPGYSIPTGPPDLTAQLLPNRDALLPEFAFGEPPGYRRLALDPSIFEAPSLGG